MKKKSKIKSKSPVGATSGRPKNNPVQIKLKEVLRIKYKIVRIPQDCSKWRKVLLKLKSRMLCRPLLDETNPRFDMLFHTLREKLLTSDWIGLEYTLMPQPSTGRLNITPIRICTEQYDYAELLTSEGKEATIMQSLTTIKTTASIAYLSLWNCASPQAQNIGAIMHFDFLPYSNDI